jgi:hypothetical protein
MSSPESVGTTAAPAMEADPMFESADRLRAATAALKETGSHAGAAAAIGLTETLFEVFLVDCAALYGLQKRVDEYDDARTLVEHKRMTDRAQEIVAELKANGRLFTLVKDALNLNTWTEFLTRS